MLAQFIPVSAQVPLGPRPVKLQVPEGETELPAVIRRNPSFPESGAYSERPKLQGKRGRQKQTIYQEKTERRCFLPGAQKIQARHGYFPKSARQPSFGDPDGQSGGRSLGALVFLCPTPRVGSCLVSCFLCFFCCCWMLMCFEKFQG